MASKTEKGVLYNSNHFQQIIDKLKEQEKLFRKFRVQSVVPKISSNDVVVRGELKDLNTIWKRFLKNRIRLLKIQPQIHDYLEKRTHDEKAAKMLFKEQANLEAELKVDLKCIFLFGDILFNKLVLLARSIYGEVNKVEYRSFTSFLKSLRKLQNSSHPLLELYRNIGNELERLDVLLGFYRDKFIVHVLGPYQEGVGMGVYHPEFNLDHSSTKLTKFDFEKFNQFIVEIKDLIPNTDKYGRPLLKTSDPRPKVEVLFRNLHRIEDASLREKAEGYIRSVGLTTPDIYTLVESIKDVSLKFINEFMREIKRKYWG